MNNITKDKDCLIETFVARLCHDIASPVGAIKLGLEAITGQQDFDVMMPVIANSAKKAVYTINMFRMICSENEISWDQVKINILEYASSRNQEVTLSIEAISRESIYVRSVFIAAVILVNSAQKKCALKICDHGDKVPIIYLEGSGEFFLSGGDISKLISQTDESSAKNALANYFLKYTEKAGIGFAFEKCEETEIRIKMTL